MSFYIEKKVVSPANHDRGEVESWERVKANGHDQQMMFETSDKALFVMERFVTPGEYRVVSHGGTVYGGLLNLRVA